MSELNGVAHSDHSCDQQTRQIDRLSRDLVDFQSQDARNLFPVNAETADRHLADGQLGLMLHSLLDQNLFQAHSTDYWPSELNLQSQMINVQQAQMMNNLVNTQQLISTEFS